MRYTLVYSVLLSHTDPFKLCRVQKTVAEFLSCQVTSCLLATGSGRCLFLGAYAPFSSVALCVVSLQNSVDGSITKLLHQARNVYFGRGMAAERDQQLYTTTTTTRTGTASGCLPREQQATPASATDRLPAASSARQGYADPASEPLAAPLVAGPASERGPVAASSGQPSLAAGIASRKRRATRSGSFQTGRS